MLLTTTKSAVADMPTPQRLNIDGLPPVMFVQDTSVPVLSLSMMARGGAATEAKPGLARITMGLLDEGAGKYNALEFQQALQAKAIGLDFSASRDVLSIEVSTLTENLETAAELLNAALFDAHFGEEALERAQRQTASYLAWQAQTPSQQASKAWWSTTFAGHPYANPIVGTLESVESLTKADMHAFLTKRLAADNMVIGMVGDVDATTAEGFLKQALKGIAANATVETIPPATFANEPRKTIPWQGQEATALFGHAGVQRTDPDYYAMVLLNHIFGGGGFDSRLMEEVREKRGLTYGVGTGLLSAQGGAILLGRVTSAVDKIDEALAIIKQEWQQVAENGVDKEELQHAIDHENGSFALHLDSTDKLADVLAAMLYHDLPLDYLDQRNALMSAVTLQDINALAKKVMQPEALVTVVVGGEK